MPLRGTGILLLIQNEGKMKKNLLNQFYRKVNVPLLGLGLLGPGAMPVFAGAANVPAAITETSPAMKRENITGLVKDSKGLPLPGVSVKLKGSNTATLTDSEGRFRMNIPPGDHSLIFTFIGYTRKEIRLSGKNAVNVTLEESATDLEEAVVVGYGERKKPLLTTSIATIDTKEIQDLPVTSLSAALRGQVVGVSVSGGQGRPGDPGQITIRNPSLFSKDGGNLRPLYIIDDVVKSEDEFNLLDVTEIESINVLRDAAAAIYGVNGNQGAILVKTRRGKAGAPQISYSGSVGTSDAVMLSKMMNGYQLASYLNNYNAQSGSNNSANIYNQDELDYFRQHNYNWLDMAWKTSMVTRHALNVSGGTDKATFFASATYNYQDANLNNINSDKWTFRASADIKLASGLKLGMQVAGDVFEKKMYWLKQGGESAEKDMASLLGTPQFIPPYLNGLPVLATTATNSSSENFHFFEVQGSDNYTKTRNTGLNVNLNLDYEVPFIKGLNARLVYNTRNDNSFGKQYGTRYNVYQFAMLGSNRHIFGGDVTNVITLNNGNMLRFSPGYTKNYQLNGQLNYNRSFGKHSVSATAIVEQREGYSDGIAAYREAPILGGSDNFNYTTGVSALQSETESESGYLSYLGRVNYTFANKYIFDAAIRADASSNFAPENRWGYFPSFSAGWIVSEEGFFKDNVNFMNFLKIRGAVGFVGANRTRPFQWYNRYKSETGKGGVFGGNGDRGLTIIQNGLTNRNVTWDNATQLSAGIDSRFLNNRLSVTVDGFFNHNYNMLTQLSSSVASVVGEQLPSENYSTLNAFGSELTIGWRDKINKDWNYGVTSFFSWSDNKLVRGDVSKGLIGTFRDPIGRSTDMGVLGYKYAGMFRTQEQLDNFIAQNPDYKIFGTRPQLGTLYYEDVNGDGTITEDGDLAYLTRKSDNHFSLGLNFNVSYRTLRLQVTSGASFGGMGLVEGEARKVAKSTLNRPVFWADHYSAENPNAKYPGPFFSDTYDRTSSFWFRSSTTIRVANVNLSYALPDKYSKRLGLSSMRAFLVGINPIDFYNPYKDYRYGSGTYNTYPTLRSWSLGLNVGF